MEEDSDDEYAPSSSSSSSSCEEPPTETEHGDADKFIIFWACLLPLLKLMPCSRCAEMDSIITSTTRGTLLLVYFICRACQFKTQWNSQPYVGRTPAGNISLSTAILAAGAIPSKVLRVLSHMQVATISTRTFCRQQRAFLFPAVRSVWAGHQAWIIASLRAEDKDVVLGGDGRCDSPGHSARFGSYTMMDLNTNVIIDMQLIQVIPMTRFY